jgi:hypothetical protein
MAEVIHIRYPTPKGKIFLFRPLGEWQAAKTFDDSNILVTAPVSGTNQLLYVWNETCSQSCYLKYLPKLHRRGSKDNITWAESDLGRPITSNAWMISKWGIANDLKGSDCSIMWVTVTTLACKELMETTKTLCQDGACPSPDFEPVTHTRKTGYLLS